MEKYKFLDRFLKIYGINGLTDYETKITTSQYKSSQFLEQINAEMANIKAYFKTSQLNLSRKDYKIDNPTLAISLLKNCLQQSNVPFEVVRSSKNNFVRLIPINNLLVDYIKQTMADITHKQNFSGKTIENEKTIENAKAPKTNYRELMQNLTPVKLFIKDKTQVDAITPLIRYVVNHPDELACIDRANLKRISHLLICEEDFIYLEIPIPKDYDIHYNFKKPEYATSESNVRLHRIQYPPGTVPEVPKESQDSDTYWYSDKTEYFNSFIEDYYIVRDFAIRDKSVYRIDINDLQNIENSLVNDSYDFKLLIKFKKSVLSHHFLNSYIILPYTGGILYKNREKLHYEKENYYLNEGNKLPLELGKNKTKFISQSFISGGDIRLKLSNRFDLIDKITLTVKDLEDIENDSLISCVSMNIGSTTIYNKFNTDLQKIIIEFEEDMIPCRLIPYENIILSIRLYQPLKTDQFIESEISYLNLEEDERRYFTKQTFKVVLDDCILLCNGGISYPISKEKSESITSCSAMIKQLNLPHL